MSQTAASKREESGGHFAALLCCWRFCNNQVIMSDRLADLAHNLASIENRLTHWRTQHPINRSNFRNAIYTPKYAEVVDATFDVMAQNPHIFKHNDQEDMDRSQARKNGAIMSFAMHKLRPVKPTCYLQNDIHSMSMTAHAIYAFDPGFSVKCDITFFLYAKTLYYFASQNPVQQQIVKKAMNYEHIGCFGLTELGHGSNVKGLLTEAIYDHKTKEFIINSPREEAMKYWIGASAEVATMSVIWAQLVIDGKKYGPHPFLVPIRDPKTHLVYPGVTVGDCGPKNGSDIIDNGYLLFKDYRIPKDYGLDRLSGVNQQGAFRSVVDNAEKLFGMYMSPLSSGRAFITINGPICAINGLTIAVRYVSQRRQFGMENKEQLIIDYPSMRHRLMPHIATMVVYMLGGIQLLKKYDIYVKQLLDPKNKMINELHAILGPCKAKASWMSSKVLTECREACAGHGYSSYSGLGRLYHGQDINSTWQGDNNMLLQQTTKYILKIANKLSRGKTFENNNLQFLSQSIHLQEETTKEHLYDLSYLEKIFKTEVIRLAQECISQMIQKKAEGVEKIDIWNEAQPYFGNSLALVFGDLYYLQKMIAFIRDTPAEFKEMFTNLTLLWAFSTLEELRLLNREVRQILQAEIITLCQWLTPRSISLLDALAPPSGVIGSRLADESGEPMREYVSSLFSKEGTFKRVDWFQGLIDLRNSQK